MILTALKTRGFVLTLGEKPFDRTFTAKQAGTEVFVPDDLATEYRARIDAGEAAGLFTITRESLIDDETGDLEIPSGGWVRWQKGGHLVESSSHANIYMAAPEGGSLWVSDYRGLSGSCLNVSDQYGVELRGVGNLVQITGGLRVLTGILRGAAATVTAASGVVDVAAADRVLLDIRGEGLVADDIDTFSNPVDGQIIIIRCQSSGYNLTLKHDTGNIWTPDGLDYTVTYQNPTELIYRENDARWLVVA